MNTDAVVGLINRVIDPWKRRVLLMVGRAVLRAADDSAGLQRVTMEVFKDDPVSDIERFQDFGFSSVPLPGADGLCLFIGGNRNHGVLVKVDDRRYRPKNLAGGESIQYTHDGSYVHLKVGGNGKIQAETLLEIASLLVTMSGDLQVAGKWGCNGASPQAPAAIGPLANQGQINAAVADIKTALIANGIGVAG